ncbi:MULTISPECIES: hypothetical protein [unclassified Paenibacillus]|uniref:hypothetical protein n=1 Tax=unclassified Paenibacillus TaxID=185978 RepID=UPI002118D331|nr:MULTISPECIES: hypothetical protein [unclassified Paenibacillus]
MMMKYFRIGRMTASAAACTLFTAVILGFFYMVGIKIISELIQLLKRAPGYLNDAILFFENTISSSGLLYQTLLSGVAEQVVKWMESNVGSIAEERHFAGHLRLFARGGESDSKLVYFLSCSSSDFI